MDTPSRSRSFAIGRLLRERRQYHRWTLAEVSQKTGISKSTLSKIENDLISPSYRTILQLCSGLDIEIGDLVNPEDGDAKGRTILGRRSVSRIGEGLRIEDENFSYTYLCADVAHKRAIPMIVEIRANSLRAAGGLWSHVGEAFIHVLEGAVTLHTEFYEDCILDTGESAYFDSTMGHAYVATGRAKARLLLICSSATPNLAQTLREVLKQRLAVPAEEAEAEAKPKAPRRMRRA